MDELYIHSFWWEIMNFLECWVLLSLESLENCNYWSWVGFLLMFFLNHRNIYGYINSQKWWGKLVVEKRWWKIEDHLQDIIIVATNPLRSPKTTGRPGICNNIWSMLQTEPVFSGNKGMEQTSCGNTKKHKAITKIDISQPGAIQNWKNMQWPRDEFEV